MARPYQSPAERARNAPAMPADDAAVNEHPGMASEDEVDANEGETASVFISADALGGKTIKAGEKITLTVKSVDPDSGEIEAVPDTETNTVAPSTDDEAMNKYMPED